VAGTAARVVNGGDVPAAIDADDIETAIGLAFAVLTAEFEPALWRADATHCVREASQFGELLAQRGDLLLQGSLNFITRLLPPAAMIIDDLAENVRQCLWELREGGAVQFAADRGRR
jgi:hypothetical protein